jgi:hypothetical protein
MACVWPYFHFNPDASHSIMESMSHRSSGLSDGIICDKNAVTGRAKNHQAIIFPVAFAPCLGHIAPSLAKNGDDQGHKYPRPCQMSGCSSGVEHNLAKVGVERSNRFTRSNFPTHNKLLICVLMLCQKNVGNGLT